MQGLPVRAPGPSGPCRTHAASVPASRQHQPAALRAWQQQALVAMGAWSEGPFLVSAAPGAGKTRPRSSSPARLLRDRVVQRVAVVCPTTPLTRQWAAAAARMGVHLAPDAAALRPPRDFQGVSVTYARVAAVAERWARQCSAGTLVIADEAHHLGEELAWGTGFAKAFGPAARWLLLSGTPFRSDAVADPGRALRRRRRGARRHLHLRRRGPRGHLPPGDVHPVRRRAAVAQRRRRRRGLVRRRPHRARGEPPLPDRDLGRPARRPAADPRRRPRASSRRSAPAGHRDAGGLVVAADTAHARAIAAILKGVTGRSPTVVLHTDAQARRRSSRRSRARPNAGSSR